MKKNKVKTKMAASAKATISILTILLLSLGIAVGCFFNGSEKRNHYPEWFYKENLTKENNKLYGDSNLRIMSYNVLVDQWGGKARAGIKDAKPIAVRSEQVNEMLKVYSPDVVALQEFCEAWHLNLNRYIKGDYKVIFNKPMEYTSMMYNVKKVTLLEQGKTLYSIGNSKTMRYLAWALFEKNDTHEKFIVTNTHLDFGDNKEMQDVQVVELINLIKDLRAKYKVPVFALGDFNALEKDVEEETFDAVDIYNKINKESTLTDANYIEGIKTFEENNASWDTPTWDHIFVSEDVKVNSYNILSGTYYKTVSDHFPIFVDAKI